MRARERWPQDEDGIRRRTACWMVLDRLGCPPRCYVGSARIACSVSGALFAPPSLPRLPRCDSYVSVLLRRTLVQLLGAVTRRSAVLAENLPVRAWERTKSAGQRDASPPRCSQPPLPSARGRRANARATHRSSQARMSRWRRAPPIRRWSPRSWRLSRLGLARRLARSRSRGETPRALTTSHGH